MGKCSAGVCNILLTVPDKVIVQRLLKRTGAAYGQSEAEIAPVLQLKHEIEPLLGEDANLIINTDIPITVPVAQIPNHINH